MIRADAPPCTASASRSGAWMTKCVVTACPGDDSRTFSTRRLWRSRKLRRCVLEEAGAVGSPGRRQLHGRPSPADGPAGEPATGMERGPRGHGGGEAHAVDARARDGDVAVHEHERGRHARRRTARAPSPARRSATSAGARRRGRRPAPAATGPVRSGAATGCGTRLAGPICADAAHVRAPAVIRMLCAAGRQGRRRSDIGAVGRAVEAQRPPADERLHRDGACSWPRTAMTLRPGEPGPERKPRACGRAG